MDKNTLLESFFDTSAKIKRLIAQQTMETDGDRMATFFQLQVLSHLKQYPAITPGKLADVFCLSSSSVAQLIDRLLTSKWVVRNHDEKDRRVVHVSLTPEGEAQLESLKKTRRQRLEPMLKHLKKEDLEQLVSIMDKVHTSMEKEIKGIQS